MVFILRESVFSAHIIAADFGGAVEEPRRFGEFWLIDG
jgi:hypothetical protein